MDKQIDPQQNAAQQLDEEASARRAFLKQAGKVAVAAPAAALLLSAKATPAMAWNRYGGGRTHHTGSHHAHGGHRRHRGRGRGHHHGRGRGHRRHHGDDR